MNSLIRRIKRKIKTCLGKDFFPKIDCKIKKERFGSEYGGWNVAIEKVNGNSVIYSFGVGEDASFDIEMIRRFDLLIHAFDPTPKSIDWVKNQNFPKSFILHEYGLADFDGEVSFNPPDNPEHVSHTILDRESTKNKSIIVPVKRLETIMKEKGHNHIDILKMDIEGAEYSVIDELLKLSIRPTQVLVEFHHRFPNVGLKMTKDAINKLRSMRYSLFSVSSTGEEFCFIHDHSE